MTMTDTYTCPQGGRCEGDGWVQVGAGYVDAIAPWPPRPDSDDPDTLAVYEIQVETARLRRAAAAQSIYPCKHCQPDRFHRWAGRHWMPDHDRAACDECETSRGPSTTRRAVFNERPARTRPVENTPDTEQPPLDAYDERKDLQ